MRKSISVAFFSLVSTLMVLGIVLMGASEWVLFKNYFAKDRYETLDQVVGVTQRTAQYLVQQAELPEGDELDALSTKLEIIGESAEAYLFFTDNDGRVMIASSPDKLESLTVPEEMMEKIDASDADYYHVFGTLGGMLDGKSYITVSEMRNENGQPSGYLFLCSSGEQLTQFKQQFWSNFLLSACVMLLCASILTKILMRQLTDPLQKVTDAAQRFGGGDFSVRVEGVEGEGEAADLARTFNRMADNIQMNDNSRGQFMGNIAHELRTPMTTIKGFVDGILDGTIPPDMQNHYLQLVSEETGRLARLIQNMLDLSKLESGEYQVNARMFNIWETITGVALSAEQRINDGMIEIEGLTMDEKALVYADPDLIHQVVYNLLDNAIKFTPAGGTVSVRVRQLAGKVRGCGQYEFRIKDNGIGMSPEFAKKIFEPFERERTSTVSRIQGTGLGMAITKNIVDLMGGSINVESTTGKGTRFEVVLEFPVDAEADTVQEAQVLPEEEETASPLSGMKFLCAEDNAINAEILQMLLETKGASCTICPNGQEIVDAFASVKPGEYDMILMDVQMPVMDGLEATRRIRNGENPLGRIIPILAMTANAFLEDMQKSREAGMDEHLSKPVDIAALEQTVKRFRVIPPKINSGQARFRRGSTQTM